MSRENPTAPPSPETTLAVILGASEWPRWKGGAGETLGGGKQFLRSANDFRKYLCDPRGFNLPEENLLWLFDEAASPDDLDRQLSEFLKKRTVAPGRAVTAVRDLLIYYVGHGGFDGGDSDYYLMIRNSRPENRGVSSLRMVSLARTIKESARHLRCYLILDCCFAARAVGSLMSPAADLAAAKTESAFEDYPNSGTALLCSSGKDKASQAPRGKTHTMFSGALLKALSEGSARAPAALSLQSLRDLTWDLIKKEYGDRGVRPEARAAHITVDDVSDLPLFPNVAALTSAPAPAPAPAHLFEPVAGETQTYIVVSEQEAAGGAATSLTSIVGNALLKYKTRIERFTNRPLREAPHVVNAAEAFATEAHYENAILAMCRSEVVVFDVTRYEPAVMLLMGIRSVVRRGVTIVSAGGDYIIGDALDFPFNIKEVNIVSHSERQIRQQEPIDIIGRRILEGFQQLATLSDYLDLPAFDAVRNLPLDPKSRKKRDYKEQVLVLCSFSADYQANNWQLYLRRFLPVYLPRHEEQGDSELLRTLDMKSPRLVSQSLYEAIRQVEMCIVDWTEWRPNVFFELGIRLAASRIGPVCVVEDSWKSMGQNPAPGRRAPKAKAGPPDRRRELAGAAGQCARLLELFDPIVYARRQGDELSYKRMVTRHEGNVGGTPEAAAALPPDFTYQAITKHIDWHVEVAAKPVHRELAEAANMISPPDVDSEGESPVLYPSNPELAGKNEVGALERRLAAWYYLDNRYEWPEIVASDDLRSHYESLGDRLVAQLLRSSAEASMELGDKIDDRMSTFRAFKRAREKELHERSVGEGEIPQGDS